MAKSQSAQTPAGLAQDPETESTRALQLLPCCGQQPGPVDVLQGGGEVAVQVVKSTESKAKFDMAEAETGAGALCVSDTSPAITSDSESGACVRICLTTRVSMFEEPCAGKSHAGICAGDTG